MRLIIIISVLIFLLVSTVMAQVPEMVEGWPYLTRTNWLSTNATPRFSFNRYPDSSAIFFDNVTFEVFKFRLDGSFYSGWPVLTDSALFRKPPILVDIDHDGKIEVVTEGARWTGDRYLYHLLYIVDDDGSIMPGFPMSFNRSVSLNVADLDGDGEYEILSVAVNEDFIHCIDRYGNTKPGWPVDLPYDVLYSWPGCAIGDLDLDGTNEYVLVGYHHIYAYRHDGTLFPGFPVEIFDTSYYFNYWGLGAVLADVDLDGYLEVLMSGSRRHQDWTYDGFVAIYEHTGEMKQNWPLMFPGRTVKYTPIAADINNDDVLEIGFSIRGFTYFVDETGNDLPGWPVAFTSPNGIGRGSASDLIVVDIDGDEDCEIFMDYNAFYPDSIYDDSVWVQGYSFLFAADHLGQELLGYPIVVNGAYFARPPNFGYDENSHRLYMSLFTEFSLPFEGIDTAYVEVYIFPDSTGPPDQWPMLSHDILMTRNYNFVDNVTAIRDGKEIIPKNYVLKQNYPNPFNTSTLIEFSLPQKEHVNLSVYDILGRQVEELTDGLLAPGSHRLLWDCKDVASGVYFYVMTTDRATISRKMMVLR